MSASTPTAPKRLRPLVLVYFGLALFDLLTISGSLYLTRRLTATYGQAVQTNQAWTGFIDRFTDLAQRAGDVNAPGNDVFDTRDIPREEARLERAVAAFDTTMAEVRGVLVASHVPGTVEADAQRLLHDLDDVAAAVRRMTAETYVIFGHFQANESEQAGGRMATMDRTYAQVMSTLATLNRHVRSIQRRVLDEQAEAGRTLEKFEFVIAGLIIFIVGAVTWYGHTISREMTRAARERETHLDLLERQANELAVARDQALRATEAKSAFLATMSHELRTPMVGVLGMTDLLLEGGLTAEQRDHVQTIRSSSDALLGIINDILDFSRIEEGRVTLEAVPFDLLVAVESVLELLAAPASAKGLELTCGMTADVPTAVVGDPDRLRQVLTNLIGNAIKFTPHGEVAVWGDVRGTRDGTARIRVRVVDTGIGVPPEAHGRLFQRFSQADGSTARRYGGTGLGLAISKGLVELMGGEIGFESTPGVGSTFWFEVPLALPAGAYRTVGDRATLSDRRVLCVSGSPSTRAAVEMQLRGWGAAAMSVDGAAAAREQLRVQAATGQPVDLVLLDGGSSGGAGADLARSVRPDVLGASVVVLGPLGGGSAPDASGAEVEMWLSKPVRPSVLLRSLQPAKTKWIPARVVAAREATDGSRGRLLVVEDNEVIRKYTTRLLTRFGYDVDAAESADAALAALARTPYQAVFLDCGMPIRDGYETAADIRRLDGAARHTPIIAMTASVLAGDRERCLAAGMDDYIAKPVNTDHLTRILGRWVAPVTRARSA